MHRISKRALRLAPWPGRLLAAVLAGVALGLPDASAAEFPEYEVVPCCDLCPAASQLSSYDTSYLKNFNVLVDGKDGWLFRSDAELPEHYGPSPEGITHLRRLARHLKRTTGTELVMVFQPTKGLVHPDKLPEYMPVSFSWPFARTNYVAALEHFRSAGL
ncbi:MAG TPA: hypothetical protein VLA15_08110, partial [Desulfurivibrionaceae bacterium]|nr:hypothetical protein [Desulfurivibrionaceae bacterium]